MTAAARKKKRERGGKARRSLAARADKFDLYQRSVQAPEADVEFFDRIFRKLRGREARSMREDFCGTALLSASWVAAGPRRRAVAIDVDEPTLEWARRHTLARAGDGVAERVRLIQADVRDGRGPRTDLTCAMNFSFCALKTRTELQSYFRVAHGRLKRDGIFFAELYGGTEAIVALEEEREVDGFNVIWEQALYNPINHATLCHIHFSFPDGSRLERAFSYDWRLWTLPEVRELLDEAGFAETRVYWEEVDDDGEGTGRHHRTEEEENQETWLVYIVGVK